MDGKCFPNGTAYFAMKVLKHSFTKEHLNGWNLKGVCIDENGAEIVPVKCIM